MLIRMMLRNAIREGLVIGESQLERERERENYIAIYRERQR